MRILHTSDWHIGKKLMGRERYEEYRAVLDELDSICEREKIELMIVSGDVFDTYTPSAEAENIFYEGIKKISANSAIVIISGNHDDSVRLSAPSAFLEEENVYILGNQKLSFTRSANSDLKCVDFGQGYAVFENAEGDFVHLNLLPYPNEARFKEERSDESFFEKMSRWIAVGESGKRTGISNIFVSHIFVAGGKASDSEREIDVGGARAVARELLPDCDYCALGHLHKRQKIGDNIYYSGAPMQFSFDEAGQEKSVNVFDITQGGVKNFKQVPLTSYRRLIRLQANGAEDGIKVLNANKDCFAELTLNLDEPLNLTESHALHECENLVSLKTDVAISAEDETVSRRDKSSSELFGEYYELKYGTKPKSELLELFLTLTEEE